jgi:hypothetical protein
MHQLAIILAILALAPAAARAEFIIQQATPPIVLPASDRSVEQARLARAYWLRTHRGPATPASTAQARSGIADGFGKDVPLRVALLQILPPALTAQFSQGVDAEQAVDWSGGKPWQTVLHDVVQPLHLRSTVSGNTVRIDPTQD